MTTTVYTTPDASGIEISITAWGEGTYIRETRVDGRVLHRTDRWETPYPDQGADYAARCEATLVTAIISPSSADPDRDAYRAALAGREDAMVALDQAILGGTATRTVE